MSSFGADSVMCPSCKGGDLESVQSGYPRFGGRDLRIMDAGGDTLYQCRTCELIFTPATPARKAAIEAVFSETAYATAELPRHRVVEQGKGDNNSREAIQAKLFAPHAKTADARILDIGCFDGALLRDMGRLLPEAELHGYDVNEDIRPIFDEGPRRRYHSGALEDVGGPFDLIVFSHSIQYIPDIDWLATQLKRLLRSDGTVIIQVPDCALSPFSLFLGDKYYHYTSAAIANVACRLGLSPTVLTADAFPRDVIVAATCGACPDVRHSTGFSLSNAIGDIGAVCERLRHAPAAGRVYVLGTTIASTFVGAVLGEALYAFADENPAKTGTAHAGHQVVHPSELDTEDLIIVPFGPSGAAITRRFEATYAGRCINV